MTRPEIEPPVSQAIGEHPNVINEKNEEFIIIIIKACQQHRFLWISLTIYPYQLLPLVSPLDDIQCLQRDEEYKFLQVGQHLCVHLQDYIGEHHFS